MKGKAFNPYLPSWEYIPDGEPYVFNGRVYVYGSHDFYNGYVFCMGDYVCWSAPVDDLSDWRYEGVIYPRNEDPLNKDGKMCLYAPDVTVGPDGRYYLYYVLDHVSVVSVAVCDEPAGRYEFYGYVHYPDGTLLGEKEGDQPQFDPGVLTEGDVTYLYTGFCGIGDKSRTGAMATVLEKDMVTIKKAPVFVAPGCEYSRGTGFEKHAFFEAPSIRKIGDTYYFIFSSEVMHELCYATSKSPTDGFQYRGVLISNCDLHINHDKPAELPMAYGANNHGSIVEINGEWYIFYHRQTNRNSYSRQACAEKLVRDEKGNFCQAEMTSCGLNNGPLKGEGIYEARIACQLWSKDGTGRYDVGNPARLLKEHPYITQDKKDGDESAIQYIANMRDGAVAGFKYFKITEPTDITICISGVAKGEILVSDTADFGKCVHVQVDVNERKSYYSVRLPEIYGETALYFKYLGEGKVDFFQFELKKGGE